eukprot:c32407_g1_i1 orf=73-234(+)
MDFIVKLPQTRFGHNALFVVVDRLTKMAHFIPITEKATTLDIANIFIKQIFQL